MPREKFKLQEHQEILFFSSSNDKNNNFIIVMNSRLIVVTQFFYSLVRLFFLLIIPSKLFYTHTNRHPYSNHKKTQLNIFLNRHEACQIAKFKFRRT